MCSKEEAGGLAVEKRCARQNDHWFAAAGYEIDTKEELSWRKPPQVQWP